MIAKVFWISLALGNTARLCAMMVGEEPIIHILIQGVVLAGLVYFILDSFRLDE